jgi:CheY-like chemotaxis protein
MLKNQYILLVEDDSNDRLLIQRAFQKAGMGHRLKTAATGSEAIDYLAGRGVFGDRSHYPFPYLLLLDLKMPGIDGFEVLQWVRKHPELKRLLIVVLTSSDLQADVDRAYEFGANSYLVKPVEFGAMVNMLQRFETYWTEINRMPTTAQALAASPAGPAFP